ncbi:MAG: 2-phospho-L-lactate transferase [Pseudomonadota bacterium]
MKYLALSGGVGGAKLAYGLAQILKPDELLIIANTGDDFTHLGLHVAPDLDSVMYALGELNNTETGWGRMGETWQFIKAMEQLGGETWFKLGDLDLATHIVRTQHLSKGLSLSETTTHLCQHLGIEIPLQPMTDDPVSTVIHTVSQGALAFQHYFVREQCEPAVTGFQFDGIELAKPLPAMMDALNDPALEGIIICPSNPFVSVDPILRLPGVKAALQNTNAPVIAVSPIVGGQALKGPAAKMMEELKLDVTPVTVAKHYQDILDGFVLDTQDEALQGEIVAICPNILVTDTIMVNAEVKIRLAQEILAHFST